ncbi:hypothetical protein HMPREF0495_01876 [Levilactobacillus brevis ATCC 14869 = DSM 20054]|uniref:Uncharacterized protein n=1 Tax=Levilactobacillus brevis ATCC 14869 = DSM 20054 TaxID=649758 RepID=U2PE20_LEVBR|nr:hypothetical protein HMPREF0495_01876 [Levilactobacillus brevis ATCC 14869 = DSM 20054]
MKLASLGHELAKINHSNGLFTDSPSFSRIVWAALGNKLSVLFLEEVLT